jgi:hypothetical protein
MMFSLQAEFGLRGKRSLLMKKRKQAFKMPRKKPSTKEEVIKRVNAFAEARRKEMGLS